MTYDIILILDQLEHNDLIYAYTVKWLDFS